MPLSALFSFKHLLNELSFFFLLTFLTAVSARLFLVHLTWRCAHTHHLFGRWEWFPTARRSSAHSTANSTSHTEGARLLGHRATSAGSDQLICGQSKGLKRVRGSNNNNNKAVNLHCCMQNLWLTQHTHIHTREKTTAHTSVEIWSHERAQRIYESGKGKLLCLYNGRCRGIYFIRKYSFYEIYLNVYYIIKNIYCNKVYTV